MTLRRAGSWALRRAGRIALETTIQQAIVRAPTVVPQLRRLRGDQAFVQVFDVTLPITVYIYAEGARVRVNRTSEPRVRLDAELRASFGWQLVAEQDNAGVYIVAKRKPVVGALASAEFTVTVPMQARLLTQFTNGSLLLENLDGKLDIPPLEPG